MVKHPNVEVALSGEDGNAFFIISRVSTALKKAGVEKSEIELFQNQAMNCDSYDSLLQHVMKTVQTT